MLLVRWFLHLTRASAFAPASEVSGYRLQIAGQTVQQTADADRVDVAAVVFQQDLRQSLAGTPCTCIPPLLISNQVEWQTQGPSVEDRSGE